MFSPFLGHFQVKRTMTSDFGVMVFCVPDVRKKGRNFVLICRTGGTGSNATTWKGVRNEFTE